jgi:dTDP-4-dehydrorhamnose 3,5-epimerase
MELVPTELPGLKLIRPKIFQDARGSFVKTFHADFFREHGIAFEPREEFFSTSAKDVLRGMHFQLPPVAHAKLVYCIAGRVLDVVLDLRKNSPTFGSSCARELNAASREMFFIPVGFAHGFLALGDGATMVYQTSTVHSPAHDAGVSWDSFGFDWPVKTPILSERDKIFPPWHGFEPPF